MGRAKGGVAAGFTAISRRRTHAPEVPLRSAERKLVRMLPRIQHLGLGEADWDKKRLISNLLFDGVPERWVIDTAVAEVAKDVRDKDSEHTLQEYLSARLKKDRTLLVKEGVLTQEEADGLRGDRIDDERSWAALRAADLLRERKRVLAANVKGAEGERAQLHLAKACSIYAKAHCSEEAPNIERTLQLLVFAHGMTDPTLEDARKLLYADGTLSSTREMMAKEGLVTEAPVVFADFQKLREIIGYPEAASALAGLHHAPTKVVALNQRVILEELRRKWEGGKHPTTVVHELTHTLQERDADFRRMADERTVAEQALYLTLLEGSTDEEAKCLGTFEAEDLNAETYQPERMFMQALGSACGKSPDEARDLIRSMATGREGHQIPLAAELLLGDSSDGAQERLVRAHWRYVNEITENMGSWEDGALRDLATECLLIARDDGLDEVYGKPSEETLRKGWNHLVGIGR